MKTAIAMAIGFSAIFLAATAPASAKLTPNDRLPIAQQDVTSLYTGPMAAMLERRYFQAPPAPQPAASKSLQPCTVQMVVFDKASLAQACY